LIYLFYFSVQPYGSTRGNGCTVWFRWYAWKWNKAYNNSSNETTYRTKTASNIFEKDIAKKFNCWREKGIPQAGTENPKYTKYKVQHPTEHELKLWFVSLCATKGAQDTEGFQHFLKSDEHRIAEFGTDYHGVCGRCTIS
jgi:hypothetical protein